MKALHRLNSQNATYIWTDEDRPCPLQPLGEECLCAYPEDRNGGNEHSCIPAYLRHMNIPAWHTVCYCECSICLSAHEETHPHHYFNKPRGADYVCPNCLNGNHPDYWEDAINP